MNYIGGRLYGKNSTIGGNQFHTKLSIFVRVQQSVKSFKNETDDLAYGFRIDFHQLLFIQFLYKLP